MAPDRMIDGVVIEEHRDDEPLLEATLADGQPRLRVYQFPGTAVVLGRGSKPELELELEACREDRVPLVRRRGGGCAVVLDPGNLIVGVALRVPGIGRNLEHFERLTGWLAAALARLGLPGVRREGHSDLVLEDRKVGGGCIYRGRELLYYSTTLLMSPRPELMERYLRHPPREPEYRRGRRHAEFVGALRPGAGAEELASLVSGLGAELLAAAPAALGASALLWEDGRGAAQVRRSGDAAATNP